LEEEEATVQSSCQDSQQPYAIVIGLDGMNGLQTARILAYRGVPVIAIAKDPKHYCCRTKVCEKILFANTESDEFIETLETLGPKLSQKAVLFPCYDMNVLLISRHRQRLEEWYHVVLPAPDVVEMMINKLSFYTYAQKEGFPIPRTVFVNSKIDIEQAVEQLTFPCILKPPVSATPEWEQHSKLKAYRVSNAEELLALYDRCKMWAEVLVVQEWIEGPNSNLYSCNCYFNADSEPVVTFIARKIRQWPPETGESCLGEECRADEVLHETVRLFQSVNYRGLGYVEMKRDERSGKYFIIEPNVGRPTGRSAIAEAGGVELLYTMYCESVGWPLPVNLEQKYEGVKWIYLRRDFQSALYHWRYGDLTLKKWWQTFRGRKTYAVFSWTDPAPFLGDLQRSVRLFLSPQERRKRDYRRPLS
jgi:predicted ATP-grasp superfamily ATP-dependent carboligase